MIHPELLYREGKWRLERDWQAARLWAAVPRDSLRHRLAVTLRQLASRLEPDEESFAQGRYAQL